VRLFTEGGFKKLYVTLIVCVYFMFFEKNFASLKNIN
jgi:hypothetical protein